MIEFILKKGGFINAYDPVANNSMADVFDQVSYYDSWNNPCSRADAVVIMTEWNELI